MIREHAGVLLALFDALKADGKPFAYTEMLTTVGLPTTHEWVRALSKFFCANGKRRKAEYTWKRETEDGGLLEPAAELDADDGDYGPKDEIAAALNRIARDLIEIAKVAGLPGYRMISIDDPDHPYYDRG